MNEPILKVENLCKSFGPTRANYNICMELKRGEVRGLAGENGSGKSTLASIICGIQLRSEGMMWIHGKEYNPVSPIEAGCKYKVAMVVQELGVIPSLSGAANIFIGKTAQFARGGIVNLKAMEHAAAEIMRKWGLGDIPLNIPAGSLSIEQRKMIELARALTNDPELLILDEITQALSHDTKQIIYKLKDRFQKENRSILIITHDLEETISICDTVTILRDGEVVDTVRASDIDVDQLKQKMIGRKVEGDYYRIDHSPNYGNSVVLEARNLGSADGRISDISFDLHSGEILGVCGLSDGGIHDLGELLFGMQKKKGTLILKASGKALNTPQDVIRSNGAYLSKNRDEEGLMLNATIYQNLYMLKIK